MICIIAGNHLEASRWAAAQLLSDNEWFFPSDINELMTRTNFHVVVVGTAGENVSPAYFEKVLHIAKSRGRIGRK